MPIEPLNNYESKSLNQAEKFSSFTEMLDLGWSLNHHRSNDTPIKTDLNKVIDGGIEKDNPSRVKLSNQNMQN